MDRNVIIGIAVVAALCLLVFGAIALSRGTSSAAAQTVDNSPSGKMTLEELLIKHAVKDGTQENLMVDNFPIMKDIFDQIVQTVPQDVRARLDCSQLTRDNIYPVSKCLLSQVPLEDVNEDILVMDVFTDFVLPHMQHNPTLELTDILVYDPVTKTISPQNRALMLEVGYWAERQYLKMLIDGEEIWFMKKGDEIETVQRGDKYTPFWRIQTIQKHDIRNKEFVPLFDANRMSIPAFAQLAKFIKRAVEPPTNCLCNFETGSGSYSTQLQRLQPQEHLQIVPTTSIANPPSNDSEQSQQ